jgi:tetratricopeptide (TPR) repeat protein
MKKILALIFSILFFSQPLIFAFTYDASREVKIIAAVSPSFKNNPDWKTEIRDRILFANSVFEKQFGLHFSVKEYLNWEPLDETRGTPLILEELASFFPRGSNEVVVGFHKMTKPFGPDVLEDTDTIGSAQYFRGYVILRDRVQELASTYRNVTLAHEIGHLFGAIHVPQSNDLMSPILPENPNLVIDAQNREILTLTRNVDFQKGVDSFSPETLDKLILVYEKLIHDNPRGDFYYELGSFYMKRNLPTRAVSIWEEAIRYHFDNPYIHRELGYYYYKNSRFDRAIQELGSAIAHYVLPSQSKEKANAFNFLGVAYYQKGSLEQAIFTWLKGLTADPDNLDLQGNLAVAYLESGDVDRAINELEKLLVKSPKDAMTLSNLGAAYLQKKNAQKALEYFQSAIANKENKPKADNNNRLMPTLTDGTLHLNLGAAYLELGNPSQAISELEKSKQLEPDNYDVHRNLAQAYLKSKRYEDAIKEIETALRYKKDDPYLYAYLSQAYVETNQKPRAIEVARQGIPYAKGQLKGDFHKNIGVVYVEEKKYNEAISAFKEAVNLNWNDVKAHHYLGMTYAQAGKFEEAKRSLRTALHMEPNNLEIKKVLQSLEQQK